MTLAYSYVRWSSEKQSAGDSERRQIALAQAYATKHRLTLADISYRDAGVSAFRGKNAVEGALAAFLKACDAGVIKLGDVLLIESFDRLSRAPVNTALRLFQDIVDRGVTIVTLSDGQRYSTSSINENWTQLIMALAVMARANEESARKGERVKAAWDAKRAAGTILTSVGPAWLKLEDGKWVLVPEKVEVVQHVFKLAAEGIGTPTIADRLNLKGVPTMKTAPYWNPALVMALLKNEAVTGKFTPKKAKADPIPNYYPTIIKPALFEKVQDTIAQRRGTGGPKGGRVANLFAGLLRCECGSKTRLVSGSKPHIYVRCLRAYSKMGCDALPRPIGQIETEVMSWLLKYSKVPLNQGTVEDPRAVLKAEINAKQRLIDAMVEAMGAREPSELPTLVERMSVLEKEKAALVKRHDAASMPQPLSNSRDAALLLWEQHEKARKRGGTELNDLRERLQMEVRRLIAKVVLRKDVKQFDDGDEPTEYSEAVLYGPIATEVLREVCGSLDNLPDDEFSTHDGGFVMQYSLPAWGFGRKRVKA